MSGIQKKSVEIHNAGWMADGILPIGGFYKSRKTGETHAWEAQTMLQMQAACNRASYDLWKQYSQRMQANRPSICAIYWPSNPSVHPCRWKRWKASHPFANGS